MFNRLMVAILGTALFLTLGGRKLALAGEPLVPLVGNHPTGFAAEQTRPAPPDIVIHFAILFANRDPAGFRRFGEQRLNPMSPLYHYRVKPGELHRLFGPKRADFDSVAQWLKSEGFEITHEDYGMAVDSIGAIGAVKQVERTFRVNIVLVGSAGAYANIGDPLIPARFKRVILNIYGLNNMVAFMPSAQPSPSAKVGSKREFRSGGTTAFAPNDLYTFYDENILLSSLA